MRISDWSSDVCSSDLMDELQEEDKVLVGRARRIQKFLGQNFIVAEKFTGEPGSVVPLRDTIEAFDRVCKGEFDHLPEQAFKIGRASCRERCVSTFRSRWSPYH